MGLLSARGLSQGPRSRSGAAAALATTLVVVIGVGLALALGVGSCTAGIVRFPHPRHVSQPRMGCGMCHDTSAREATYPGPERCAMCHDAGPAAPTSSAAYRPLEPIPLPERYGDVIFDHGLHGKRSVACSECHRSVHGTEDAEDRALLFPPMETCTRCHAERGGPRDCSACHTELSTKNVPQDHRTLWTDRHGPASRGTTARCELCHDVNDFCVKCHEGKRPRTHTLGWRLQAHGLEANRDRDRCATCHRADECARCHSFKKPATHTAANWKWGGHKDAALWNLRSCSVCHIDDSAACGQCHPPPF